MLFDSFIQPKCLQFVANSKSKNFNSNYAGVCRRRHRRQYFVCFCFRLGFFVSFCANLFVVLANWIFRYVLLQLLYLWLVYVGLFHNRCRKTRGNSCAHIRVIVLINHVADKFSNFLRICLASVDRKCFKTAQVAIEKLFSFEFFSFGTFPFLMCCCCIFAFVFVEFLFLQHKTCANEGHINPKIEKQNEK